MGNYASCALSTQFGKNKSAKVILPSGEIKQFQQSIKAAELMLEIPNYFLVNSKSLQIGKRFSALNADEDLEMGNVYVMFGMKRVNSFVNAADMGAVYLVAKRGARKVRVVPSYSIESDSPAREEDAPEIKAEIEELLSEFTHRRSVCRSKKPVLETIVEEPVFSRKL
ncbi:hypothetical protein BVRB_2g027410 [Beta vulgaris subsp. vulgaris]|uniref:uncharacterized protein LOC104906507 n=1 Tax=Beta vulgaris subsp. vulgaris TaxID=3555 RepID=UPI000540101C|nr:uncharacterized protein LOC104906507 [Beta vulgaris subsp. vulgaris]KMT18611.1 hypothetical protein BVRB_2g027410 [Beta vulgaris subsp. vulgaris]